MDMFVLNHLPVTIIVLTLKMIAMPHLTVLHFPFIIQA
jgi:hypothetical protein